MTIALPETGFIRLPQLIGRPAVTEAEARANREKRGRAVRARPAVQGILPMSRASFYTGIRAGKYPAPVKVGNMSMWRAEDIRAMLEKIGGTA